MIVNDGRESCYRLAGKFSIFFCPPKKTEKVLLESVRSCASETAKLFPVEVKEIKPKN
jgi:hypothetical protein